MPQQRFDLLGGEPEKELLLLFWYRYVWNGAKKDEWEAVASRCSTGRLWRAFPDEPGKYGGTIIQKRLQGKSFAACWPTVGIRFCGRIKKRRVIGYAHLVDYDVLYAPSMKNIMGIAVSPQYRRKGVGRVLLETGGKVGRRDRRCRRSAGFR